MLNILYFSQKILSEERTEKFNEPRLTQAFIFDNNSNSHLTDMQTFVDPIQKVQFCIVSEFVNAALANQQREQYNEAPTSGRLCRKNTKEFPWGKVNMSHSQIMIHY